MVPTAQHSPSSKKSTRSSNSKYQDSNYSNNNSSSNNTSGNLSSHQMSSLQSSSNMSSSHLHSSSNMSSHHMSSLHSFGFEAIEEDELTEASYKMSNLGLSEMDMTFGSDVLSVRSKSANKMQSGDEKEKGHGGGEREENRRASAEDDYLAKRSNSADGAEVHLTEGNGKEEIPTSSAFNRSPSSTSVNSKSSIKQKLEASLGASLGASNFSMEDFNESFKSMEMRDSHSHNAQSTTRTQRDPDGDVGGTYSNQSGSAKSRKKEPIGGRLPSMHSARSSHRGTSKRRDSTESLSMRLSDPDILNSNKNLDFGVSFESLRSFQSEDSNDDDDDDDSNNNMKSNDQFNDSDASSWLNQYNSMENIESDKNPWDDEDQAQDASDGTSLSEISAPRMVTASGGGE